MNDHTERTKIGSETMLVKRDAQVYMHHAGSTPCRNSIKKANGVWLEDHSGHRFMDFHGNNCHHIGYGNARVINALKEQLDALPFAPRQFTNAPAVELAERLTAIWPGGSGKILLATGGSDAVEIALKIVRLATGRHKTLSFRGSYHGNGYGALSLGWRACDRIGIGPFLEGPIHVRPFYRQPGENGASTNDERWARACLSEIKTVLETEKIAAIFSEPIRSTPHIPPNWFWPEVRTLCDAVGTLLVFDEIPTGLGKTGRMFVSEHFDVVPDITILGKSLGGGILPIAATIFRSDLDIAGDLPIGHYTHEKNPITTRAALTTLEVIIEGDLVARAEHLGKRILSRLGDIQDAVPGIRQVRCIGLLGVLEFDDERFDGDLCATIKLAIAHALKNGLSVIESEGRNITLSPPLVARTP